MSNVSLIESLEKELDAYLAGRISSIVVCERFNDHLEALEGIPYSVILEGREFQMDLEIDGYHAEEGMESDPARIVSMAKEWLLNLRREYGERK